METIYNSKKLELDLLRDDNYRISFFDDNNHWNGEIVFNENKILYSDIPYDYAAGDCPNLDSDNNYVTTTKLDINTPCCAKCKHCTVLNKRDMYAVCTKNDWTFKPFEQDTRKTFCNMYQVQEYKKYNYQPKTREELKELVDKLIAERGNTADLNDIDTSLITDMCGIFCDSEFNGDISGWDVSNVTNMASMFACSKFNQDISKWNVYNVKEMSYMFYGSYFNGDISSWDVSNVTNMECMFSYSKFNNDISKWDVSNVTDMDYMFSYSEFNKDISSWDVSKVTNMGCMFCVCPIKDEYKPKFK